MEQSAISSVICMAHKTWEDSVKAQDSYWNAGDGPYTTQQPGGKSARAQSNPRT